LVRVGHGIVVDVRKHGVDRGAAGDAAHAGGRGQMHEDGGERHGFRFRGNAAPLLAGRVDLAEVVLPVVGRQADERRSWNRSPRRIEGEQVIRHQQPARPVQGEADRGLSRTGAADDRNGRAIASEGAGVKRLLSP
jgi:hypothetical protein